MIVTVIGCDDRPPGRAAAAGPGRGEHRHRRPPAPRRRAASRKPPSASSSSTSARPSTPSHREPGPVVVLASGDPGFFGIVRALRARGIAPAVIPAVSSVALAFARLGLDWDDALVVSAHGRDPGQALAAALAHPKAAILTAPGTAAALGAALLAAGKTVHVVQCLGTPHEQTIQLPAATDPADPNMLIALDEQRTCPSEPRWLAGHQGAPDGWALPEDAFAHRDSMITKAEVRALVLARLGPGPGRVIWDVGAGSGSVAVECARFGARVIAVEADPAQCERIQQQRRAARRPRPGPARPRPRSPRQACPRPTRSSPAAATTPSSRPRSSTRTRARIVVTLAAVSRVAETAALLTAHGYQADGVQLQASRLAPLPDGQLRLAAQNPVFVLWGNR